MPRPAGVAVPDVGKPSTYGATDVSVNRTDSDPSVSASAVGATTTSAVACPARKVAVSGTLV